MIAPDTALPLTQLLAIGLLSWCGGRIGWRIRGSMLSTVGGAVLTGGLGLLITALKYLLH